MSKPVSFFIVGLLVGCLGACLLFTWLARRSAHSASRSAVRVLRVAHVLPTSHPVHRSLEQMAARAGELSRSQLKLEVYPSEQLGNEVQCLEQVQAGTLAITKVSAAAVGNFVSTYKLFALPYLFRDSAHFWNVLDGPIGQEMLAAIAQADDGKPSGLRGLCFYDAGSRNFYGKEPIRTPQDLKGKKIRVMNDPVAIDLMQAFGSAATPIPWGELYTALQQGVVDGAENNPPSLLASRHYEVCKHFTLNHHTRIPDVVVVSARIWDRLTPEEQSWLEQAARESSAFERKLWTEESLKTLDALRQAGVTIHEVDDQPFREAARPVLEKYAQGKIREFITRIEAQR
jgi:tripartite ATP-independent transporter DctP family solute receptor